MNPDTPLGQARLRRFLDRENNMTYTDGVFTALFQAYQDHVRRWELHADGLTLALMRETLAAGSLHLASRPLDETFGITVNISTPPVNLFVTGDAWDATVTGRAFVEGVKTSETGRFFMQARRRRSEPVMSAIDVKGLDVLGMFEEYYSRSEQNPARFYDLEEDRFLMVLSLPDGDKKRILRMERDEARDLAGGSGQLLGERLVQFRCGCNPDRIVGALRSIYGEDGGDLFLASSEVEAHCPRCGARWPVSRESFGGSGDAGSD